MNNLTLYKNKEGFFITSEEDPKLYEWYYDTKQYSVRQGTNNAVAGGYKKPIIASNYIKNTFDIDFSNLRDNDKTKIGCFDIKKIIYQLISNDTVTERHGVAIGFGLYKDNFAEQIYTIEDIREALINFASDAGSIDNEIDITCPASVATWITDHIKSLLNKSWKIEGYLNECKDCINLQGGRLNPDCCNINNKVIVNKIII